MRDYFPLNGRLTDTFESTRYTTLKGQFIDTSKGKFQLQLMHLSQSPHVFVLWVFMQLGNVIRVVRVDGYYIRKRVESDNWKTITLHKRYTFLSIIYQLFYSASFTPKYLAINQAKNTACLRDPRITKIDAF